jgi:uncharacterized protein (DUF1015 family)
VPNLLPFKALHPSEGMIEKVASKTTDFETEDMLIEELKENPHTYHHVTKLHLLQPTKWKNSTDFLPQSRLFLERLISENVLTQDSAEGFYIYRQTIDGTSHTGVIGLCDMEDYRNNHIRKHEYTRHEREEFISALLETTSVIGEPLLLSHHHRQSLEDLLRLVIQETPDNDFEKGGRFHQIWKVVDPELIQKFQNEMQDIPDFYIMDGHHRIASVSNLYEKHKTDDFRYAMSFVLDADQLSIDPFHRLVEAEVDLKTILARLSEDFEITEVEDYIVHPANQRSFVLKAYGETFALQALKSWGGLDVDLFENKVLNTAFNITDTRSDQRLKFLAGDSHLNEALELIKQPNKYLFLLHPCSFREIAMTSDAQQVLPPKSTFVEPKCRAGLFIQPYGNRPF